MRISTLAPDGSPGECGVTFRPKRWYELTFLGPPLGEVTVIEPDFVVCLAAVRELLEERGWRILCNGSRVDAWSPPLARQSDGGLRAQLLDAPKGPAGRPELVSIFAPADAERIATVAEQRAYVARRLFPNKPLRDGWSAPIRMLRPDLTRSIENGSLRLRSLAVHATGMRVSFRLALQSDQHSRHEAGTFPRVDVRVWDDVSRTYEPSAEGAVDGRVVNASRVSPGAWDITSWLRPSIDPAVRQLDLPAAS